MAIEVGRLLEDVRWALNCDLSAARTSAVHLAAFLANKLSRDVHITPARGGLAPWQKRKVRNHIENGLEGQLPVEDLAMLALTADSRNVVSANAASPSGAGSAMPVPTATAAGAAAGASSVVLN